jgi:ABC-2 type transport system ATP-binding protein
VPNPIPNRIADPQTMLRVDGLGRHFGSLAALADVSFSIRAGEILGLIGPNGAGKTTLFECIAGVLPPGSGTVRLDGRPLSARDRSRTLFYVPDAIAPWPAQRVEWALNFTIDFFGGRRDLLEEIIEGLHLAPLLGVRTGILSKGQRKRVLLAIGLLTSQPILLADEPFDGLDLRQTGEAAAVLRAHAARGRTLFLSIHQIADAARVCDRFVLLSGGRVCGEGTLEDLTAASPGHAGVRANLEEVFLALT